MNEFEQKQEERKARYLELAEKADKASETASGRATGILSIIPMGQPIFVGHHSERRHRRDLATVDRAMRKSIDETNKADHYRDKAAGVGKAGISSDDPEAVVKLRLKLAGMEDRREGIKKANRLIRKKSATPETVAEGMGWKLETAIRVMQPDYAGRIGFPSYELTNLGANIRRVKGRIEELLRAEETPARPDVECDGFTIHEDRDENRIRLLFDGKPPAEVRAVLKRNGFRWSPTNCAWQRHLNNAGRHAAEYVRTCLDQRTQAE